MASSEELESIEWASTLEYDNTVDEANRTNIIPEIKTSGLKDNQPLPRQWLNQQFYNIWQVCLSFQSDFDALEIDLSDLQSQIDANKDSITTNKSEQNVVNNDLQSQIDALELIILEKIFSVGSTWNTKTEEDPAVRFGFGTWVKLDGRFIAGSSETDAAFQPLGALGGNKNHTHTDNFSVASHTLTEAEVPTYVHNHEFRDRYHAEDSTSSDMVQATNKENMPAGYNGNAGSGVSDLDNNQWLYYDTNTENATFGGGGGHSHVLNGNIDSASNLPPYAVFHVWERIS